VLGLGGDDRGEVVPSARIQSCGNEGRAESVVLNLDRSEFTLQYLVVVQDVLAERHGVILKYDLAAGRPIPPLSLMVWMDDTNRA
jgi:hypothetical protein